MSVFLIVLGVGFDCLWVEWTNNRPLPLKTVCGGLICCGAAVLGASIGAK